MKFKATKKEMLSHYDKILGVGYCDLQSLLNYIEPIAYSTRSEGWACDYYEVGGILISTGYAPLSTKNLKKDYETIRRYNDEAAKIIYNYDLSYNERKEQVAELLNEFIEKIKMED